MGRDSNACRISVRFRPRMAGGDDWWRRCQALLRRRWGQRGRWGQSASRCQRTGRTREYPDERRTTDYIDDTDGGLVLELPSVISVASVVKHSDHAERAGGEHPPTNRSRGSLHDCPTESSRRTNALDAGAVFLRVSASPRPRLAGQARSRPPAPFRGHRSRKLIGLL